MDGLIYWKWYKEITCGSGRQNAERDWIKLETDYLFTSGIAFFKRSFEWKFKAFKLNYWKSICFWLFSVKLRNCAFDSVFSSQLPSPTSPGVLLISKACARSPYLPIASFLASVTQIWQNCIPIFYYFLHIQALLHRFPNFLAYGGNLFNSLLWGSCRIILWKMFIISSFLHQCFHMPMVHIVAMTFLLW